jgi:hypothetical protein
VLRVVFDLDNVVIFCPLVQELQASQNKAWVTLRRLAFDFCLSAHLQ